MKCSRRAYPLLIVLVLSMGCARRQAMYKQSKVSPYDKSDFFSDGRGSRNLVEGTVAQGKIDDHFTKGVVNGTPVTEFPYPMTRKDIERGMQRYTIFCSACHSRTGDGWGMVVQRGLKRPPSFHEARLKAVPVSHFFNVISNGIGMMSGYASQIPPEDRWAIIAYVRALQLSQDARLSDVPESERSTLEAGK
jgi:mono/diheme cytochrome c family protein